MKRFTLILMVLSMMAVMVGIASAQDETRRNQARSGLIREIISATSAETGLDAREIITQLAPEGATLADVIVANGGSVDAVISASVTNATDRINQAIENGTVTQDRADEVLANLEQLVTDAVNGDLPLTGDANPRQGLERALITAVTEATGMQPTEIVAEVRGGKTLVELITESGSTVDAVVADAVATVTERVNQWVENERITQEQADELLANLESTFTDILNGDFRPERPDRSDREGRGPGILRKIAQDTGLTPQELLPQLRDGATPAQILIDNGIDVATFVDELLVNTEERLAEAVANERITQEQADERLDTIRTTLTDRLNQPLNQQGTFPPETESGS